MREREAIALSLQSSESITAHVTSGITAMELERDRAAARCAVLQSKWESLQTSHVQLVQTRTSAMPPSLRVPKPPAKQNAPL